MLKEMTIAILRYDYDATTRKNHAMHQLCQILLSNTILINADEVKEVLQERSDEERKVATKACQPREMQSMAEQYRHRKYRQSDLASPKKCVRAYKLSGHTDFSASSNGPPLVPARDPRVPPMLLAQQKWASIGTATSSAFDDRMLLIVILLLICISAYSRRHCIFTDNIVQVQQRRSKHFCQGNKIKASFNTHHSAPKI
jgi:hypothetical protein